MTGFGFSPTSLVTLFMFSTPVQLGSLPVGSNGAVAGALLIPASTQPGSHTVQAVGRGVNGQSLTLSLGVTVLAPAAARGAHPVIALAQPSAKTPGSTFAVVASGVQARCPVTFWVKGSSVTAFAGVAGHATAFLKAPQQQGRWAVTLRVSGSGCDSTTVKTFVQVRR